MPRVREIAKVMIGADALWKEVGDFGAVAQWHPRVSSAVVSDDSAGRARLLQFETGGEQRERLTAMHAARRIYRYVIERPGPGLPVRDCNAELRIEKADTQMSRIIWEAQFTLAEEGDDRTVAALRAFMHEGLANIQGKYRPYARLEPDGVDRGIADADKKARTGTVDEPVRNTPPAGAWNETSSD